MIKNQCVATRCLKREFINSEKHYNRCGNYCLDCMRMIFYLQLIRRKLKNPKKNIEKIKELLNKLKRWSIDLDYILESDKMFRIFKKGREPNKNKIMEEINQLKNELLEEEGVTIPTEDVVEEEEEEEGEEEEF